jgi:hypothetical protein
MAFGHRPRMSEPIGREWADIDLELDPSLSTEQSSIDTSPQADA